MTLYKYVGPSRVTILEDQLIRYTQPKWLNDPFEMTPNITELISQKDVRLTFDRVRKAVHEQFPNLAPKAKPFLTAVVWLAYVLRGKAIRKNARAIFDTYIPKFQQVLNDSLNRTLRDNMGVLSLSESCENLQMWAHYAASHTGFVIAINEGHKAISAKRSPTDEFCHPRKVCYSRKKPSRRLRDLTFVDVLLTKSMDWAHEAEWRVIKPLELAAATALRKDEDVFLFELPADAVEGVILGAQMPLPRKEQLLSTLRTQLHLSHVWIKQAELQKDRFALKFRALPGRPVPKPVNLTLTFDGVPKERSEAIGPVIKDAVNRAQALPLDLSKLRQIYVTPNIKAHGESLFDLKKWDGTEKTDVIAFPYEGDVIVIVYFVRSSAEALISDNASEREEAIHLLDRQFVHAHNVTSRVRMFGADAITTPQAGVAGYLKPIVESMWNHYFVCRTTAASAPKFALLMTVGDLAVATLDGRAKVAVAIVEFRPTGKMDTLMRVVLLALSDVLNKAAEVLGYADGLRLTISEMSIPSFADTLEKGYFAETLGELAKVLQRMYEFYPEWTDLGIYDDLLLVVRNLASSWNIMFMDEGRGVYVAVP